MSLHGFSSVLGLYNLGYRLPCPNYAQFTWNSLGASELRASGPPCPAPVQPGVVFNFRVAKLVKSFGLLSVTEGLDDFRYMANPHF